MSSMNKVILIGRLGGDPDVRQVNDTTVSNFSLATSERWKDRDSGEFNEKTEWHRVVAWGKQAEIVEKFLSKGSQVCVEGKLQTRKWQDSDGNDRYTTEIRAHNITMLGARGDNESSETVTASSSASAGTVADDDIPF